MNVAPAWQKGYTGKGTEYQIYWRNTCGNIGIVCIISFCFSITGIVVSILDDGIQTNHPDLAQNYVSIKR